MTEDMKITFRLLNEDVQLEIFEIVRHPSCLLIYLPY